MDEDRTLGTAEARPQLEIAPPPQPKRDSVDPVTAELSRFHFTVSRRFLAKLDAARDALSHSHPGASTEEILEEPLRRHPPGRPPLPRVALTERYG